MAKSPSELVRTQVTVCFDSDEEIEKIDKCAEKENRKRSNFIVHCVREYMARKQKEEAEAQ